MKLILGRTTLVFKSDVVKTQTIEGLGMSNIEVTSGNGLICFPIQKGTTYKVVNTPLSGSPIYKWANTEAFPTKGTPISDYAGGGGMTSATTREFTASIDGYHIIQVTTDSATIEVTIS